MKRLFAILCCCSLPLLGSSCGYRLGGLVNGKMKNMKTYDVRMFRNATGYPHVAMQMTTAMGDVMQNDGTFRMANPSQSDFSISGTVKSVSPSSLITNPDDTYVSLQLELNVDVEYEITDRKTGKVIKTGTVIASGSYYNTAGNIQSSREIALAYATRKAAMKIVDELTLP